MVMCAHLFPEVTRVFFMHEHRQNDGGCSLMALCVCVCVYVQYISKGAYGSPTSLCKIQ